ncbi:hypothetical protein DL98DRAFT_594312 [Cadophora sp. DSE1049]|nr:hypothetical protein DL98DRAFT_594312 [Cadophora sp. DSE1049]
MPTSVQHTNNLIKSPSVKEEIMYQIAEFILTSTNTQRYRLRRPTTLYYPATNRAQSSDYINHYAIMWKKQLWVLSEERLVFDTVGVNPEHTDHYAQCLIDVSVSCWTISTKVEMGFARCWIRE